MHDASTTIKPVKAVGILLPVGPRRDAFRGVMQRAKEAFGQPMYLTCITAERAFFQILDDRTFYSIAITTDEAATLGFIRL